MPFALDGNPSPSEISDALNYLLSNFNVGNTVDPVTGQVVAPGGVVVGYIYQYLAVKYADDQFGTGFSSSPTGKSYYGLNNSANSSESTNPADYIWYEATGGFGTTKFLWYLSTGGRQIQFAVSATAPDTAWLIDPGSSIDLDVVTSGNIPVIAETFTSYFTPSILFVPRTGNPLTPQFTGINPTLYATNGGVIIPYSGATTDSNAAFVNNSWRIGNSSTTGFADITYTNITVGSPTDGGDYAEWPAPTAMTGTAYIDVPIRYKDSLGNITQASVASIQLAFADPGVNGDNGPQIDFSGFTGFSVNNSSIFTPATATLSAIAVNVTSPTYSWSVTGGTPTTGSSSSIVVTPNSAATTVVVSLTVNGTNLASPVTVTKSMPVTFDGVPGTAGANGLQSAFPSIYIWTGSSAPPTRPSTTSTYTWSTGSYTAPSGWSTTAPSNTTAGNYLWQITVPLNVTATTTTSTLDWTNVAYPIRSIAYNGTNGLNASILTLSATAQAFTYNGSGIATPIVQTITFTAGLQNLTGTATFTCTLYSSSGSSLGTVTLGGSGNNRTLTNSQFSGASYAVVQATLSGYSDLMTVVRLQDGATGATGAASVTGLLTNEAASVAATSSGTVPSFAGTGGNFLVYSGTTDVTSSSTFSVASSSGVTISITSGGVYTVTAMSANQGSATLRAVYGSVTIDKVYNISKAIAGVDGANASVLTLTSTGLSFTYDGSGNASPSSQTLSFTANLQNLTGTATFTCTLYNSAGSNIGTVTMGGSGNTRTLTDVQFSSASYAVVIASLSGYSDTMTVVRLQNGANGTNGTNGTNGVSPIVGLLTNEAVTLQASSSGTVVSFTPGNGNFLVFQGTTDVSGSATYSVVSSSGITVSIAAGGAYTLSGMSANYGTATFRAVYGSVTIDKVYTVAKSIAGVDGLTASLLFLTSTSQSFTYDGTGAASPSSQTINFTANLQNLSGTASFNCDLYNSSGSNIGTVTLGGTGNTRSLTNAQFSTAAYAVINATLSGFSDTVTVVRLQNGATGATGATGAAGQNAVVGLLTNEAVTVAADSSGNVVSFSTAGGTFQVFNGLTDVTSSSTFSVSSSTNVTISINSSGVYSVSAMSASQGSAVLQAVYGSTTIQKIYNISKSIAGANGTNGTRTAILDMYLWSASTPTVFPSGTSTYTWATGQFTAPATTNGWSLTPPAAVLGQTLYIARTIYADTGTSSTSSVTWTATTATSISASGSNGANGTNGTNGSNGYRTAFLEVYQWNNTTPTSFPSGTSIYTWSNGSFTAPATLNGWSLTPGASTPGYSLYACSVTYADTNTSSTSSVTWSTSTAYVVGYSGVNGSTGATGATGSAGSATFLVTRTANDSSPPTNAETNTAIGRNPVAGDIVTVSYNSANNAVVYRYTTSWVTQATYLTGSLIVDGTITASKLSVSQLSAITANLGNITSGDIQVGSSPAISGTTMTGSGTHLYSDGRIVSGNTSNNLVFDGTTLYLNLPFLQNPQTISQDATVANSSNALSIGPITVATGVSVTVPTGSVWTVV